MKQKNQKQVDSIGEIADKFISRVRVTETSKHYNVVLEFKCGRAITMREWIVPKS